MVEVVPLCRQVLYLLTRTQRRALLALAVATEEFNQDLRKRQELQMAREGCAAISHLGALAFFHVNECETGASDVSLAHRA